MSDFDPTKDLNFMPTRWPLYWRHEKTGRMAKIVMKFLEDRPLRKKELAILRWYVWQWCDRMPNKPDDYDKILSMSQAEIKEYNWNVLVSQYSIDPF